ncbi:glycoside hydrolase family 15 protein [Paenibacillus chartarius]|uniref:Glycoside hydrolase family 15 protein n=1 Tax=Paenibacillus chartarius TaxID=747481 RepID=A0ABV6DI62_9BACL
MARDLPIGNGNVLVNYDLDGHIRDLFYPHVGQENQSSGYPSRFGVWSAEGFFWLNSPGVQVERSYAEDTLATDIGIRHDGFGIELALQDAVDSQEDVFLRKVTVKNNRDAAREVKLYVHLDLDLYGNGIGDTIYFDPELQSLVFYKGHRYLSLSCGDGDGSCKPSGYSIGQKRMHGLEGTWRDAEDGKLGGNPIAQGSVDAVMELTLQLPAGGEGEAWFWIGFARGKHELESLEGKVRARKPRALHQSALEYWRQWVARDPHDLSELEPELSALYRRSLLVIRSNMDNGGAIIAANDSDILKFAKDTYSYMWPRDGALISHALDRSGYHELTRAFFDYCKRALTPEGYLMHKYNPDGSPGSSWHPWVNAQGQKQLAIQEDETALVVYTLWHHHRIAGTVSESRDDYERFIIPAADFLVRYRDASGLPLPSYDLWEERYGVFAFTVASVYAGLIAAADMADAHGDKARAVMYRDTAERVKGAAERQLYSEELGRFLRALYWDEGRQAYAPDLSLDMSMYALFDFEMFDAADPRIERMMRDLRARLWVRSDVGGIARYENDYDHQVSKDIGHVAGNPWFICTLWLAEYLIDIARTEEDLQEPLGLMRWAAAHTLPSGVMAEQLDPYTGAPLSVSPLTWSHASFVKVTQEYVAKRKQLRGERASETVSASDAKVLEPIG